MTTWVPQVSASGDDGEDITWTSAWDGDGSQNGTGDKMRVGRASSATFVSHCGIAFRTCPISGADTVNAATLSVNVASVDFGSPSGTVRGVDVDDFGSWSDANRPSTLAQTTASTATGTLSAGAKNFDVKGIVDEIFARGGWAANNDIAFSILNASGSNNNRAILHSYDSGTVPSLTIDYTLANNPPTLDNPIPDQTGTTGGWNFAFAADTFSDPDSDPLTYSATQADDSPLPGDMTFTSGTRTFDWPTPTEGTTSLKVTADDGNGGTVTDTFDVVISAAATSTPKQSMTLSALSLGI